MRYETADLVFLLPLLMAMALFLPAASFGCDCGPDFCPNDSRYPQKLAEKKTAMKQAGHPDDLIALLDLDGACVARVEGAPDGFSIKTAKGENWTVLAWNEENERIAREQLKSGKLDAYYKLNVTRAFECCGDPKPEERPDWEPSIEQNTSLAIRCVLEANEVACG